MRRFKTRAELEQEIQDASRWATGNVTLDTTRLLLIYARQSSSKQYVSNIYSAIEQRDGLLERAWNLGWKLDEQRILYVENQLAKKTQVSGSLRIDQRPGLEALTEVIKAGKASAVLVVSVDRITRDEDLITPTAFANLCKQYHILIITDEYTFDFNNPTRDDMGRFMNEAIAAKEYIRKQVKGKMLKGRTRKGNMGRVANGVAPIGLKLDENTNAESHAKRGYNLVPSSHAERVNQLYARFRSHDANLTSLQHEIINEAKAGRPLFPDADDVDPKTVYLKRMVGGWTISTRYGLKYILSNPMYAGHLVFNGRVVKKNAHLSIVDADLWQYAFDHLSDVDLEGNPIEHGERTVRYTQQASSDNGALLAGTRHNGQAVIDSVNGAHCYVQMPLRTYTIKQRHELSVNHFKTGILVKELDAIVEARLLHILRATDRTWLDRAPYQAMKGIEQTTTSIPGNTIEVDLSLTKQELSRVERALRTSADVMADSVLTETYTKQNRLIKRQAELEQALEHRDRLEREQKQACSDLEQAAEKWGCWSIEKRRQFIRLVTDSITLEEIADGWLRLSLVWSPIMGFVWPLESSTRASDVAYMWRANGSLWSEEAKDTLREYYQTATRGELQRLFPSRSYNAIAIKAASLGLSRPTTSHYDIALTRDTSLSDQAIVSEYMLEPGKRVQWQRGIIHSELANGDGLS